MDMAFFRWMGINPLPSLASSTASKNMRLVEKDLTCPAPLLSFRKAVVNGSKQKYSLESLFLGSGNDVETHFEIFRTSTFSADASKKTIMLGVSFQKKWDSFDPKNGEKSRDLLSQTKWQAAPNQFIEIRCHLNLIRKSSHFKSARIHYWNRLVQPIPPGQTRKKQLAPVLPLRSGRRFSRLPLPQRHQPPVQRNLT